MCTTKQNHVKVYRFLQLFDLWPPPYIHLNTEGFPFSNTQTHRRSCYSCTSYCKTRHSHQLRGGVYLSHRTWAEAEPHKHTRHEQQQHVAKLRKQQSKQISEAVVKCVQLCFSLELIFPLSLLQCILGLPYLWRIHLMLLTKWVILFSSWWWLEMLDRGIETAILS